MNIEEERKAFLIECASMFGNAYYPADTGFANGEFFDPTVQRPFEVWLKAKAHAEEMAKPAVKIREYLPGNFSVWNSFDEWMGTADSREECETWFKANGYRVVE